MELLNLLLADLGLLEPRLNFVDCQVAALVTLGDQRTELLELRDRSVVAKKDRLIAHSPLSSSRTRLEKAPGHGASVSPLSRCLPKCAGKE